MKNLKKFGAILSMLAFFGLAGCGGDLPGKIDKLADEACACKDKECMEKVGKKFEELLKNVKKEDVSEGDAEKVEKSMSRMMECAAKIEMGK